MRVIGDLSRAQAHRWPEKIALVHDAEQLSYRDLDRQSNQLAHALLAHGVAPGERVAVLGHNSIDYAIALQAIAKCAAIVVPLNFRLSAAELEQALRDAEPVVLLAEPMFDPLVEAAFKQLAAAPALWTLVDASGQRSMRTHMATQAEQAPVLDVTPESAAMLLYTSGTTGKPKGVLMSHEMLFRMFAATAIEAGLTQDDVALLAAPMFHLAGMNMALNQGLYLGMTGVVFRGRFEPDAVFTLMERSHVSWAVLVPTTIAALVSDPRLAERDLSCLRKIFYGSMPITPTVLERARSSFPNVAFTQLYGSTECGMTAVLRDPDHARWSQCTGREALLSRLRIVDEHGLDVAEGKVGEIIVDSRQMGMIGYWRNPQATQEAMQDGWIRSGDLARVEGEGFFTIVDRLKDVIISGGENIYPKEVEQVISAHPAVSDVAVFGIPDDVYGETVCAALVLRAGKHLPTDELENWCAKHLARYKRPRRVEFHDALPRNASDKVQKQLLRAPHWVGRKSAV